MTLISFKVNSSRLDIDKSLTLEPIMVSHVRDVMLIIPRYLKYFFKVYLIKVIP